MCIGALCTHERWACSPQRCKLARCRVEKIKTRSVFFEKLEKQEKEEAIKVAKIEGWPIIVEKVDGTFEELMKLTPDGFPVYYATTNVAAARSTRANFLFKFLILSPILFTK